MPNHVESDLSIHGDPEALKAFMDFAEGPAGTGGPDKETVLLSAHRFIPYPDQYAVDLMECTKCAHQFTRDPGGGSMFPNCPDCGGFAKDGYNRGGYDWCITNWGTKWGLYDIELTDDGSESGSLAYTFQTAWSPPVPVIQAMSKQFPSLTFALDYFEGLMGFMGSVEYEGGEVIQEGSAPYHGNRGG
jgi:hypothetical protein